MDDELPRRRLQWVTSAVLALAVIVAGAVTLLLRRSGDAGTGAPTGHGAATIRSAADEMFDAMIGRDARAMQRLLCSPNAISTCEIGTVDGVVPQPARARSVRPLTDHSWSVLVTESDGGGSGTSQRFTVNRIHGRYYVCGLLSTGP